MKPVLRIFVAEQCPACVEARTIARQIEADYPGVTVQVVNINDSREAVPEQVFATPTYMLGDRVVSLGNPAASDIARWLKDVLTT